MATSNDVLLEWQQFFGKMGIIVQYFDFETIAVFRSLFHESSKTPVCIVDIGTATTNIAIFSNGNLRHSHQVQVAGEDFTEDIAKALNINDKAAEIKKIELGISDQNNQIFTVLVSKLESIIKAIRESLSYFENTARIKVENIILVGGSSQLKGLLPYLKANLGGDVTKNLNIKIGSSSLRGREVPLEHLEAIGLALRGLEGGWNNDPMIRAKDFEHETVRPMKQNSKQKVILPEENITQMAKIIDQSSSPRKINKKLLGFAMLMIFALVLVLIWPDSSKKDITEIVPTQDQLIEEISEMEEQIIESVPMVEIVETETGWLNVRTGPGTSYEIITKINPEETYPFLEEDGEWYSIELSDGSVGWIASRYAIKSED